MIWEFLDLPCENWIWTGFELGVCFPGKSQMLLLTEANCSDSGSSCPLVP